jgi:Fe2+ or Zn2+ uptake regulation protein
MNKLTPKSIQDLLKNQKLKVTPQRLAILTEIAKEGHISVDDIYLRIKDSFPSISLATVYKNLNSMKEVEIVYEIHTYGSKPMYEIKKQSHAHFICQVCNSVKDMKINKDDFKNYGNFNQIDLYLYGICDKCKNEK